jgi:hypothetical protein
MIPLAFCVSAPAIQGWAIVSMPPATYRQAEYEVRLRASFENPFDSAQVALDAEIVAPSGRRVRVPGFLYRPYRRATGKATLPIAYASTEAVRKGAQMEKSYDRAEVLVPSGEASWRVRFTPTESGTHRVSLTVRDRVGIARKTGLLVRVAKSGAPKGFVRVDGANRRAFRLSTGEPYFPIGANVSWAGERGTRDYDDWLPEYAKAGANWGRVWLSPTWTTFSIERSRSGTVDLANAWRLDYVLNLAERNGLYLALCIDSYNVLRDRINWPEWERSPYNAANGGAASNPLDFWSDAESARRYRDKLRYLVARWGPSPNVFAWEFWNEVDGVADYRLAPVLEWHRRMGAFLKKLDPYRHLVSTSFGGNGAGAGDASVFALPEMDYSVSHLYDAPDGPSAVASAQRRLGELGKPHFVAEFGADASGSRSDDDPEGLQLHDPLWASIAVGASGGSMLWWWDSYIHPRRLYPLFRPAREFLKGIDWGKARLREVRPELAYASPGGGRPRRDLRIEGGPATWSPSPANRPQTIHVNRTGMVGGPVSGFLHGVQNHKDLHNPITFETDLPWPTRFVAEVGDVSGYGGAGLRATMDGKLLADEAFTDPDGDRNTETLKGFAGDRGWPVPAGKHRISVENPGRDWVRVDYRFEAALERTGPPLIAWASVGRGVAFAWVRHEDRTWRRLAQGKLPAAAAPPALLTLPGLTPGRYRVEIWNTWNGHVMERTALLVHQSGRATVRLPGIDRDLAVRLVSSEM